MPDLSHGPVPAAEELAVEEQAATDPGAYSYVEEVAAPRLLGLAYRCQIAVVGEPDRRVRQVPGEVPEQVHALPAWPARPLEHSAGFVQGGGNRDADGQRAAVASSQQPVQRSRNGR
jgi:hypothetical protein